MGGISQWLCRQFGLVALLLAVLCLPAHAQASRQPTPERARYSGIIVPAREAELAPRLDASLQKIHFRPGQFVSKNDLLFEFAATDRGLRLEIERARLARAEAKLRLAEANLTNRLKLRKKEVASEHQLLEGQANRDSAAADVAEARAVVQLAELEMKELKICAPIDGMMSAPNFAEGTYLKRELKSRLARIIQLDPIRVSAQVPFDVYYDRRLVTQTDKKTLDSIELTLVLPNGVRYPHAGHLVSGAFQFKEKSQTIQVWAEFPNPDHLLRPGLKVQLESRLIKK